MDWIAAKSAIWVYMMLVVGTFHLVIDINPITQELLKIKVIQQTIMIVKSTLLKIDIFLRFFFKKLIFPFSFARKYYQSIHTKKPIDIVTFYIKMIIGLIIFVITMYLITLLGFKVHQALQNISFKQARMLLNPSITSIQPNIIYKGMKVIVYGKQFTERGNTTSKVFINNKLIIPDLIDNNKVIISIPLDWNTGLYTIYLEKEIIWNGKRELFKTNSMQLKVIPVSSVMTPDDDAFFRQLPTLDKETLKINGY